jgi:predicted small secreted protein
MKIKNFLIGTACGFVAGWAFQSYLKDSKLYSSEEVLKRVKEAIKKDGKIIGSWIVTKPETIDRHSVSYQVYRGGITKLTEEKQINVEFLADAKSGTILEIEKL